MTKETKMAGGNKAAEADLMAAFEAFRDANDTRLAEIEARGASDPLTDERLARIDRRLEALSLKMARPEAGSAPAAEPDARSEAWGRYLRSGDESGLARLDVKALNAGTDAQGGYTAPPELDRLIEARLMAASPMRQIATVRQTSAGTYRKPVSLGAAASWVSETGSRTETAHSGLSLLEFPAGELYAMPAATQTLLEDSYSDIDAWLADEVENAFAAQESAAFVSGDGANKPKGFLDYDIVAEASHVWGKVGSVAGDFTAANAADQLIDLIYTPKSQFRTNGRFVMNRRTVAAVRKLKDGDGRYLWQPGTGGDPATILGYPVTEVEDMPDIGTGNAAIAFGDFRRVYPIADRQGARVLRDPFSAKPYVLFYTTGRRRRTPELRRREGDGVLIRFLSSPLAGECGREAVGGGSPLRPGRQWRRFTSRGRGRSSHSLFGKGKPNVRIRYHRSRSPGLAADQAAAGRVHDQGGRSRRDPDQFHRDRDRRRSRAVDRLAPIGARPWWRSRRRSSDSTGGCSGRSEQPPFPKEFTYDSDGGDTASWGGFVSCGGEGIPAHRA
ncbi:MAG: phage major capsid protein [Hyphomonas sp.]